jgi:hypothetical protein
LRNSASGMVLMLNRCSGTPSSHTFLSAVDLPVDAGTEGSIQAHKG